MADLGAASDKVPISITFLEMTARPTLPAVSVPAKQKIALLRAERCTVSFYRYLYDAVGRRWLWVERKRMSDANLQEIIRHESVDIHVLYVGGVPAGYSELDRRRPPEIDIAYFGIVPEFIGQGFGPYFLRWTIDAAWQHAPMRLTVNTCNLDHPAALPLYQKFGFRVYDRRQGLLDISVPASPPA